MATELDKIQAKLQGYERKELKNLSYAAVRKQFDQLEDCYKACLALEEELIKTLPGARERGVNGDDVKQFKKDPIFKKVFKKYDDSVTEIDKAEKEAVILSTAAAHFAANDLGNLLKLIEKTFPKSRDKNVERIRKHISDRIDDLKKAADLYEPRGAHKKIREYSSKFDKKVENIIAMAPPSEKPDEVELPKELDPKEIDKAEKTLKGMYDQIVVAMKNIAAIEQIRKDGPTLSSSDAKDPRKKELAESEWKQALQKHSRDVKKWQSTIKIYDDRINKFVAHYVGLKKQNRAEILKLQLSGTAAEKKEIKELVSAIDDFEAKLIEVKKQKEIADDLAAGLLKFA